MITVTYQDRTYNLPDGSCYRDAAAKIQPLVEDDILLMKGCGRLQELSRPIEEDTEVSCITLRDHIGHRVYGCSLTFLAVKAIDDLTKDQHLRAVVDFSVYAGYYIHFPYNPSFRVTAAFLKKLEARMRELIDADIPFEKKTVHVEDAIKRFAAAGQTDKEKLFRYRRSSRMNIYSLDGYEDYYYGYMVDSTRYLKVFGLEPYRQGLVVQVPRRNAPKEVPDFNPSDKLFAVMKSTSDWGEMLGCSNVGELNDIVAAGKMEEMILVQEALMEKQIGNLAERIVRDPNRRVILIAGPSSSGKTTFSHRLSVQLRAHGAHPHPIAVDNYFVDREKTPRNPDGTYNFEDLGALDVEQFVNDIEDLIAGKTVKMPTFNFLTGKREYRGDTLTLGPDDILVVEGIHCLNPAMSEGIPAEQRFKIYISALTALNLDDHNRIATTDERLIRRLVRDARTRGHSAKATIAMWPSVRAGEQKNIFPYQDEADAMFNSALIYELGVLKAQATVVLSQIRPEEDEYQEAKRLLKFLDYFLPVSTEAIPSNSIVREFVGGGCFKV